MKILQIIFLMIISIFVLNCSEKKLYCNTAILMGTYVEVISPYKEAIDIAFNEIKKIEGLLSKYDPDSEVSYLNREGKAKLSNETFYVIKKAKEFFDYTEGAFDITVGPLLRIWGFDSHDYKVPTKEEIEGIRELIGSDKIVLEESNRIVEFKKKGMFIDLGAIAKGYAVDCAVKSLKEKGIKNALINAGGDIYCLGDKFGKGWQVGIRDPKTKKIRKVLRLSNKAIATSGDYENFFVQNNNYYSHIFDPKTGFPVDSGIDSVTIVADDCLTADALATAVFVLGEEKGKKIVEKLNARLEDIVFKK